MSALCPTADTLLSGGTSRRRLCIETLRNQSIEPKRTPRGRKGPGTARARKIRTASADSGIEAAISHHRAGRLADARRLYAEIQSREPNDAVALHHLGVIEYQEGNPRQARPGDWHDVFGRVDRALAALTTESDRA